MARPISLYALTVVEAAMLGSVLYLSAPAEGLICYNCHLTPGKNFCSDASQLLTASQNYQAAMEGNLTLDESKALQRRYADSLAVCDPHMDNCVIESIIGAGQYKLMFRDCSDGKSFSTNVTDIPRLANITPHNITHCGYSSYIGAQVCITLCQGDYCNGPSADQATRMYPGPSILLLLPALSLLVK